MKLPALIAALVLSSPAVANDWYVDAVNGDDGNGGTSPTDAWMTISHALMQIPATGPDTVHVADGTYDSSLGESFPVVLRNELAIIGSSPDRTIVSCTASQVAFYIDTAPPGSAVSRVERLAVRGAQRAFRARANFGGCLELALTDVLIEECQFAGSAFASVGGFICHYVRLTRVHGKRPANPIWCPWRVVGTLGP